MRKYFSFCDFVVILLYHFFALFFAFGWLFLSTKIFLILSFVSVRNRFCCYIVISFFCFIFECENISHFVFRVCAKSILKQQYAPGLVRGAQYFYDGLKLSPAEWKNTTILIHREEFYPMAYDDLNDYPSVNTIDKNTNVSVFKRFKRAFVQFANGDESSIHHATKTFKSIFSLLVNDTLHSLFLIGCGNQTTYQWLNSIFLGTINLGDEHGAIPMYLKINQMQHPLMRGIKYTNETIEDCRCFEFLGAQAIVSKVSNTDLYNVTAAIRTYFTNQPSNFVMKTIFWSHLVEGKNKTVLQDFANTLIQNCESKIRNNFFENWIFMFDIDFC